MDESLIKSADRVKDHGEVFTPQKTVKLMLDQPEIQKKIRDLNATFLEPSAGEGAFLVELLKRRMVVAEGQSKSATDFGELALRGLATLYGIEYLEDNVEMLVMNMITTFEQGYRQVMEDRYQEVADPAVLASAKVIVSANMVQGDTLKQVTATGEPIIFSEWVPVPGRPHQVQRKEHTLTEILEQGAKDEAIPRPEQLDLFALGEETILEPVGRTWSPVKWTEIYLK